MTAAEVVACVRDLDFLSGLVRERVWNNDDQHVGAAARIAFHEAAKLLDSCAPKTCGTCADWERSFPNMPLKSGSRGRCNSETSECATVTDGETWSADHGCPAWRGKKDRWRSPRSSEDVTARRRTNTFASENEKAL